MRDLSQMGTATVFVLKQKRRQLSPPAFSTILAMRQARAALPFALSAPSDEPE